jgi:hypothetical protein
VFALASNTVAEINTSSYWAHFNTVCARCHEAQCSGRLSLADMQSRAHVERYSGQLPEELYQQLVIYLQYMKEDCGIAAPPSIEVFKDSWTAAELQAYRTPDSHAYFIPLGILKNSSYQLQIDLEGKNWTAQVIASNFDTVAEGASCNSTQNLSLEFRGEEDKEHYLRIEGRNEKLQLKHMQLLSTHDKKIQ